MRLNACSCSSTIRTMSSTSSFAQDRRVIELNVRTLAKMAVAFKIPVILSTVGVEMGANGPTIESLRSVLPHVQDIDRSTMNAWGDPKFVTAVKATGRKRLVMCGILTSACLTYPVVSALADGYEVTFIEDAVGDSSRRQHDTAVLRLAHAGAIPNTTVGMIAEWFLDWKLPVAKLGLRQSLRLQGHRLVARGGRLRRQWL